MKRDQKAAEVRAARADRSAGLRSDDLAKLEARAADDLKQREIPATASTMRIAGALARLDLELARGRGNLGVLTKQILKLEEILDRRAKEAAEARRASQAPAAAPVETGRASTADTSRAAAVDGWDTPIGGPG